MRTRITKVSSLEADLWQAKKDIESLQMQLALVAGAVIGVKLGGKLDNLIEVLDACPYVKQIPHYRDFREMAPL